jgi:glycerophosphoryl diester phosphodiesterase
MAQARVLNIAHRGACAEAPENTLPAFERAIEAGADWLELDIHATSDGRLVVMHDEDCLRTTGVKARVAAVAYEALRELDAGAWFGEEFAGTRIPTLAEVAELASGRAGLLVEVKSPRDRGGEIARALPRELEEFGGELWVQSFDPEFVWFYKRLYPERPAVLISRSPTVLADAIDARADGVSVGLRSPAALVAPRAKGKGLAVLAWTVRGPASLAMALHWDVDGVINDRPAQVKAVLDALERAAREEFGDEAPEGKAYIRWRQRKLKGLRRWAK